MNGSRIASDTNVILYLMNGEKDAVELLQGKEVWLSFITEIELLSFNLAELQITKIKKFLAEC